MKKKTTAPRKPAPQKRSAKKTVPAKPAQEVLGKPVGRVTHFYNHLGVAIVEFSQPVSVGATLRYRGATTDFVEQALSMQYDHKPVTTAPKGKQVGIKVKEAVREGDLVYPV
jgi:hypothetical protein